MKLLALLLCFVFVILVEGQGYGRKRGHRRQGRGHNIVKPVKPVFPKVATHHSGGNLFRQGGSSSRFNRHGPVPQWVRRLAGSTYNGAVMKGGAGGLPAHGGAGRGSAYADGLRDGWGANPNVAQNVGVSGWSNPNGRFAIPSDYQGQELVFDHNLQRYVYAKKAATATVGHNIAKNQHAASSGSVVHTINKNQHAASSGAVVHNINKNQHHNAVKTGTGMRSVGSSIHNVHKAQSGEWPATHGINTVNSGISHVRSVGHEIGKNQQHNTVKIATEHNIAREADHINRKVVSGVGAGNFHMGNPSVGHAAVKSTTIHRSGPFGAVNAGHISIEGGMDGVRQVSHNIAKATLGADQVADSILARSLGGAPVAVAHINPNRHFSRKDMTSSSSSIHHANKDNSGVWPVTHGINRINSGPSHVRPFVHEIAKDQQHNVLKSGTEHNIAKDVNHMNRKVVSGVDTGRFHMGVPSVSHNAVKSTDVFASDPFGVNAGHISIDGGMEGVRQVQHNVAKVTLGADQVGQSMIARHIGGNPVGVAHINPARHFSQRNSAVGHEIAKDQQHNAVKIGTEHNFVKQSNHMTGSMPSNVHNINKAAAHIPVSQFNNGVGVPVGGEFFGNERVTDPVHNVQKVSMSGQVAVGHDPLAVDMGQNVASQVAHQSSKIVDEVTGGGVSNGDPFANRAAHGISKETIHVAAKTLNAAGNIGQPRFNDGSIFVDGSSVIGGGHMFNGGNMVGGGHIMPKPIVPKKKPVGGYGRSRGRHTRKDGGY